MIVRKHLHPTNSRVFQLQPKNGVKLLLDIHKVLEKAIILWMVLVVLYAQIIMWHRVVEKCLRCCAQGDSNIITRYAGCKVHLYSSHMPMRREVCMNCCLYHVLMKRCKRKIMSEASKAGLEDQKQSAPLLAIVCRGEICLPSGLAL